MFRIFLISNNLYQEIPWQFPSNTPNIANRCFMRLVCGEYIVDKFLKDAYRHYAIYRFWHNRDDKGVFQNIERYIFSSNYSDFLDRAQLLTQMLLKQDYSAPRLNSSLKNMWSSLRFGWPRRNIHISNDKGDFTFYVDFVFFPKIFTGLDCIYEVTRWVAYEKQELLTLLEYPDLWWVPCCSSFQSFVLSYHVFLCA